LVAIDNAKNRQLNSSLILIDESVRFAKDEPVGAILLCLYQYGWTKLLASSKDELAMKYEIEKYGYTSVAFSKQPPMIKLEWDSIEVYCKRIQIENSFWGESYVYLFLWFVWVFIALVDTLLLSCLRHSMSFMASSVIDVRMLYLALNNI